MGEWGGYTCRIVLFSFIDLFFKFAVLRCPASLSMEVGGRLV